MSERKARAARKAAVLEWGKSWMDEMAQFDGVPATKTVEDMMPIRDHPLDNAMVNAANQFALSGGNPRVKMMPEQAYRDMCERWEIPIEAVFYRGAAILAETEDQFAWAVREIDWSQYE